MFAEITHRAQTSSWAAAIPGASATGIHSISLLRGVHLDRLQQTKPTKYFKYKNQTILLHQPFKTK